MFSLLILTVIIGAAMARIDANVTDCDGHQANFDIKTVMGSWHVVAIIPEKLFPENQKYITCYKMDLSETDGAGLRWLVSRKIETPKPEIIQQIQGTIVRQRYHSEKPFDVWSKSIKGINGCFRQVLSLDTDKTEIGKAISHDAIMQLHLLETNDKVGPFLVQILWGRMISAVIYRRHEGVTQEQLKPVFDFMNKLRGAQRLPRICVKPLKEILLPSN